MELHNQIKEYRKKYNMSQEALADAIYVSRQSVSNWETGKNYPDILSILALSDLFEVSLDTLVKGDLEIMKNVIEEFEHGKFKRLSLIYAFAVVVSLFILVPLVKYLGWFGLMVWVLIYMGVLALAYYVEKEKKRLNIQTYQEITDFMDGKHQQVDKPSQSTFSVNLIKLGVGAIFGVIVVGIALLIF